MLNSKLALLPNCISLGRILCLPVLLWLAFQEAATAFAILYLVALVSDLLDGWLARRLRVASRPGALLDSVADILLTLVVLWCIWILHPHVYLEDGWVIYSLLLAWLLAHSASMWRYGRLASFHTWLVRIGIAVFNLFAIVLFVFDYFPWLLYLSATLSLLGVIEHFVLLALLPKWRPDIPGGVFRVLSDRNPRH